MASIQAGIQLADRFTAPLMNIINSVNMAVSQMEALNSTMNTNVDASAYEGIRSELHQATTAAQGLREELSQAAVPTALPEQTSRVGDEIQQNTRSQQSFNQSMQRGVSGAKSLVGTLMGLSLVRSAVNMVKGQLDSALNRMDTMTTYNRTMTAITGDADVAAASLAKLKDMTKGTAYGLDSAARAVQTFVTRGMGTGDAVNQVKAWSDAVAFYGDGTSESLTEVTDALGKMLTKGKVEMVQLDRLTYRGINAVGIYAQATGQSAADVQTNLSKGNISAQEFVSTVSNAFENGTNGVLNISGAAKKAGDTWAASIANAKAAVTRGLISVIDSINEGLSNAGFGTILDGIKNLGSTAENVLGTIGNVISGVITVVAPVAEEIRTNILNGLNLIEDMGNRAGDAAVFVSDNWSLIGPIVYGVVGAFSAYYAILGAIAVKEAIYAGAMAVETGIKTILCIASIARAAILGVEVAATTSATAAQLGLNSALWACPITWIIALVVALIAVIIAVITYIVRAGNKANSVLGDVCGAFKVATALIYNIFAGGANLVITVLIEIYNLVAKLANFVANVFNDPVGSVARLFGDLLDTIMSVAQGAAEVIDTLLGTDYSGGISGLRNQYSDYIDGIVGKQQVYVLKTLDASKYMIKRKNYSEAYKSGASFGDGVTKKVKNMFSGSKATSNMNKKDYNSILNKTKGTNALQNNTAATAKNTAGTAKNTAKSAQALSATSEDLKYLRDMAAQKYINRFTTAKITVHQTNHNKINKKLDLDGVTEHLRKTMEEQMISAAEGVHI